MSRRLYGQVKLKDGRWHIKGEPHMILELRRIIPRVGYAQEGDIAIKDTDEVCRRLLWFLGMFPLSVSRQDRARLDEGSKRHVNMLVRLDRLIDMKYKPHTVLLAVPPREYQMLAAELLLHRGFLLLADDVGLGKAQPLDAKVLTPSGWTRIGDLKVGDMLIDPDGGYASVTGIHPQGLRDIYRVTMTDGASTECCDEHLWLIQTPNDRMRGGERILPLKDFKDKLISMRGNRNLVRQVFLPLCLPPSFGDGGEFEMKPYLLGALLGDGQLKDSSVVFSKPDVEILDRVGRLVPEGVTLRHAGGCDYRLSYKSGGQKNPLVESLRALGLAGKRSWEKFIPDKYLFAPQEDRLSLLRGLMDTDGTCGKDGISTFTSTSDKLADGVAHLVRSLGGFCSKYSRITIFSYKGQRKEGRKSFTLNIRIPVNPFFLSRKAERWKRPLMAYAVDSVEPVGKKEAVCISASSRRNLYVTDDFIVTHNTVSALCALTDPRTLPAIVVTLSGTLPLQWQTMIGRFMPDLHVHVVKKGKPYELPKINRRGPDIVILNYHKLDGWADTLREYGKTIIFDEAQELRRSESKKYEAAKRLARAMRFRCGLSATPIFNYGGEIWNVINVLQEDVLGSHEEFEREWCTKGGSRYHLVVKDPKALGSYLRAEHIMLRRTRMEVGRELPPLQKIPQFVESDENALDKVEDSAAELARIILTREKTEGWDRLRASEQFSQVLRQATGVAKCLALGTRVIKADGSMETVENLKNGDLLLGPDGKPRRIVETVNGYGEMYEVSSTSRCPLFEPYIVNGDHVLALKHSGKIRHGDRYLFGKYVRGDHLEVAVSDYLTKSKHFRRMLKGYKVGVEFCELKLPLDPYFLGLWLGDGNSSGAAVTTADKEIVEYLSRVAEQYGVSIRTKNPGRTAPTYFLAPRRRGVGIGNSMLRNPLMTVLRSIGVLDNKHIPQSYLTGSRVQRMRLLAGLIDSDGHFNKPGVYTILTRWSHLAYEMCLLAWSLGLAGKKKMVTVRNQQGKTFTEYRVCIYGNGLEDLPLLVPRKKSPLRRQIKDPLRSGISVKPIGLGPYYGFALDGDGLFLLHDFTVTHNSPYVADFIRILVENGEPVIVFAWHREVYGILQAKLKDLEPVLFTGSESPAQKEESRKKFVNGDTQVLLMSLRAGQGIDGFQDMCRTVVFAELDWSPAIHSQAIGRVARDGQKEPCVAYFMVADRGADPMIAEKLGLKTAQLEGIQNPEADILEELQTDENRILDLARAYLERIGRKDLLPAPSVAAPAPAGANLQGRVR